MRTPARRLSGKAELARRSAVLSLLFAGSLVSEAAAQPPPVSPDDFVTAAGGSDQYEIMAARVALVESRNAGVRAFAQQMVQDHGAAFTALSRTAVQSGLKPPSGGVGGDQRALLATLQSLRGPDFNKAYIRQQVLAHRQALTTEAGYARNGSDPRLRDLAKADAPMIERHLQAAQRLS